MALFPVAGMHIYIGGILSDKSTDFIASDFGSQSWTEIDGWTACGPVGDTGALITTAVINRSRDVKQKGTANAGQMKNQFAQVGPTPDPGQELVRLASVPSNKNNYAIRVDLNDTITTTPSKRYFVALIMDFSEAGGGANTIRMVDSTFEINSNIVRVAAV